MKNRGLAWKRARNISHAPESIVEFFRRVPQKAQRTQKINGPVRRICKKASGDLRVRPRNAEVQC